ncbi:unnamed protein product [Dovyalis caffra]|uniref:Uncharacterized protein n=1 Tax=Dovyalis caffra TaxID=77055 RepID=A0AAV1SQY0_9ROSI|nr:unnamed protein product [Dovyalis caffra]
MGDPPDFNKGLLFLREREGKLNQRTLGLPNNIISYNPLENCCTYIRGSIEELLDCPTICCLIFHCKVPDLSVTRKGN